MNRTAIYDWADVWDMWSSWSDDDLRCIQIEWDCPMCMGYNFYSEPESTYAEDNVICDYCSHPFDFRIPEWQLDWEGAHYCNDYDMPWEIYPDDIPF